MKMKRGGLAALMVLLTISTALIITGCKGSGGGGDEPTPTFYRVTFDGGAGATTTAAIDVESGKFASKPSDPTRTGFEFLGWFTAETGGTEWNFTTDAVTANITLYAHWKAATSPDVKFTVTFNANGGSGGPTPITGLESGSKIDQPAATTNPTRSGFTFKGWFKEAGATNAWVWATDTVTANTTLYAGWDQLPTFTITFNANGGVNPPSPMTGVAQGSSPVTAPAPPNNFGNAGHSFRGWFKEAGATTPWVWGTDVVNADIILYAGWAPYFNIIFNANGGLLPNGNTVTPQSIPSGDLLRDPGTIVRHGYAFDGWYTTADFSGSEYNFATPVTAVFELYAKWVEYPSGDAAIIFSGFGEEDIDVTDISTLNIKLNDVTSTITVTVAGTWDSVAWSLDGVKIAGAAEATYELKGDLFNKIEDVGARKLTAIVKKGDVSYSKELTFAVVW